MAAPVSVAVSLIADEEKFGIAFHHKGRINHDTVWDTTTTGRTLVPRARECLRQHFATASCSSHGPLTAQLRRGTYLTESVIWRFAQTDCIECLRLRGRCTDRAREEMEAVVLAHGLKVVSWNSLDGLNDDKPTEPPQE